jgi:hypothetical protein
MLCSLCSLCSHLFFNGEDIDGALNYKLDCRHILVPSRRECLELVMDELLLLAW